MTMTTSPVGQLHPFSGDQERGFYCVEYWGSLPQAGGRLNSSNIFGAYKGWTWRQMAKSNSSERTGKILRRRHHMPETGRNRKYAGERIAEVIALATEFNTWHRRRISEERGNFDFMGTIFLMFFVFGLGTASAETDPGDGKDLPFSWCQRHRQLWFWWIISLSLSLSLAKLQRQCWERWGRFGSTRRRTGRIRTIHALCHGTGSPAITRGSSHCEFLPSIIPSRLRFFLTNAFFSGI